MLRVQLALPHAGTRLLALACLAAILSGCSVVAAPCRITGAVVKTVPIVGKVAAVPFDACGEIID